MCTPKVVVVGGGLAGMTAAFALLKEGWEVVLLEAQTRLGGKAGADPAGQDRQEHGNHFFPPWYLNTRRLLTELGLGGNLVDLERLHQLRKGRFPRFETLVVPTRLSNLGRNIFGSNALPWTDAALLVYSFLDLACQPQGQTDALDSISLDEFLNSRAYCMDSIRDSANALVVKSIATSTEQLSALTKQTIVRHWLKYRVPMYSILNANLQDAFIHPFEMKLRSLGCQIRYGCIVKGFASEDGRISAILGEQECRQGEFKGDIFVLALPADVLPSVLGDEVLSKVSQLSGIRQLCSSPMGAMTLHLSRFIPGLPKEHVILVDSRYALSFIDVSQTWPDCKGSVLTFNIGEVQSLMYLSQYQMAGEIVGELRNFIPEIREDDIEYFSVQPNVETPLLLNTKGSWRFRPAPGRTSVPNLFLAGDYCRSAVNVTSMEGAVESGLTAALTILQQAGYDPRWKILVPAIPPLTLLLGVRSLLYPVIYLLSRWKKRRMSSH